MHLLACKAAFLRYSHNVLAASVRHTLSPSIFKAFIPSVFFLQVASSLPSRIPESETDDSSPKSAVQSADSAQRHRLANSVMGNSSFGSNLRIATTQAQITSGLRRESSGLEGSPRVGGRMSNLGPGGTPRWVLQNSQGASSLVTHPSGDKFPFGAGELPKSIENTNADRNFVV